uniref:nucleotide pyrophosphatase/phosphodiesterase family protein n=1 Tax=Sandarakinorhabdus sp. TaxID=1916663 RepID=UPI00286D7590
HGIVSNTMDDAALGKFSLSNRAAVEDRRWWDGAEPIWVTAQKAGISAATMFWPGSEAAVRGVRPAHWLAFDGKMPEPARVDRLLAWLDETPRPGLGTLYFDSVDHDGHEFGPDAPQTNAAIAAVDVQVGRLVTGLEARGIAANIVLVADHGMAPVSTDRQIMLDDLLPATSYRLVTGGAVAGIMSNPGQAAGVAPALLRRHAHMQCWRKSAIPRRLHYGRHPRVPDLVCVAAPGWMIWARAPKLAEGARAMALGGMHGYDPAAPDMAASFVAAGPAFRAGKVLAPFDNVDVHPLLLHLLGLPPMQTDGRLRPLRPGLRHR